MRRIHLVVLFCLAAGVGVSAQATVPGAEAATAPWDVETHQRLLLATSSEAYPVTPGDVYRLTYRQGEVTVTNEFLVESDYTINMKVFGALNAMEMTFTQLKPLVEKAVTAAYPRSMPSLMIVSLGIFQVFVKGETPRAQNVVTWGLARLSEIIEPLRGPSSSLRNVAVISRDGTRKLFDVYRSIRHGIAAEDPLVKPGDTIVLSRSERRVEVTGAVFLRGTYELLPGEQLRELVEAYGGGAATGADVSRLRIERRSGDHVKVDYVSLAEGYARGTLLEDGDIVTIPSIVDRLPVVSFEGAVMPRAADATASAAAVEAGAAATPWYNSISHAFKDGETLSDALRAIRGNLAPLVDLASVTVLRDGAAEPVFVDARDLLRGGGSPSDIVLQANDRIVIPMFRFSVLVSGAVAAPGTYPYAPDRDFDYYLALAGGIDPELSGVRKVVHYDPEGKRREAGDKVLPGDRLTVRKNDFMYNFNRYAPIFVTLAGLIYTSMEIYSLWPR